MNKLIFYVNLFISYLRNVYNPVVKTKIESKPFRRSIYQFLFGLNEDYANIQAICDVNVYESELSYTVEITTHRPGFLIGKAGYYIDELREHLQSDFPDKLIVFDIKESQLWRNLY